MNWIYLILGGLFEACFAFSLEKVSHSTSKELVFWLISFIVSVSLSMFLLYKGISGENGINVSIGYAVWAGLGAVFTVLAGTLILKEPMTTWKIFFLSTLILSIVGLNLFSQH